MTDLQCFYDQKYNLNVGRCFHLPSRKRQRIVLVLRASFEVSRLISKYLVYGLNIKLIKTFYS